MSALPDMYIHTMLKGMQHPRASADISSNAKTHLLQTVINAYYIILSTLPVLLPQGLL